MPLVTPTTGTPPTTRALPSTGAALTQAAVREGVIELSIGQPDPTLLPADALAAAAESAVRRYGADALGYGAEAGPGPLVDWLREHLGRIDGRAPSAGELLVTAGISQALDLVATVFTRHGDVALVEVPTYHLALGILADHGLDLVGVPTDDGGLDPDALEGTVRRLHAEGRRVSMLYTIPTFGNPTGRTLSADRRRRVAELGSERGFVVVEDDVYRELWFDGVVPPSIGTFDPRAPVVRLGSFSKSLAPGLRLGWLTAPLELVARVVDSGVVSSGGGLNPLVGLTVAEFAAAGRYEPNVAALRETYRERRDVLVDALRAALPGATFDDPDGGYFVWLRLPAGLEARALLPVADAAGVTYVPGDRFDASGTLDGSWLRLSFARYPDDALAEGARRLGEVVARALG
jgi:2-aminoadipate transaminase